MKTKIPIQKIKPNLKGIFKKEPKFSNTCKICGMKFPDPERTKKHMIKAHSKPKKHKEY